MAFRTKHWPPPQMPPAELLRVADALIDSVEHDNLSDDLITSLLVIFPENLLVAALDLIDRGQVTKYTLPWESCPLYEVSGSSASYSVFLDMGISPIQFYCACPDFAYAVLISGSHIMCKHILAARLANRLARAIECPMTQDDLQAVLVRRYSDLDGPSFADVMRI